MSNYVVLVDENDHVLGIEEKLKAHQNGGVLHRAFSLILFNKKGQMLLQKRADCKYHCPGEWTNSCCSHPPLDKSIEGFARERLMFEMGMGCDEINSLYTFIYKKAFKNGLTEYELDHVLIAQTDEQPDRNEEEVGDTQWITIRNLYQDLEQNPEKYTFWFRLICQDERFKKALSSL